MGLSKEKNPILVTGGAGFIGSNFILDWLKQSEGLVINLDKLTYAGNLNNLESLAGDQRHQFFHGDISDRALVRRLLSQYQPVWVVNFAAESHVDRSIRAPGEFIQTNIVGVFDLLEEVRAYWQGLGKASQERLRFIHVSTDEVYGSLAKDELPFTEGTPYRPNSPYAASKAASDHLVRAYHHTYGLPTLTTNCSNNYGPYQYPEKLVPLMILNSLQEKSLPIYGDGGNIRDWLYVGDHCAAIRKTLAEGRVGSTYNIGGGNERTNLEVADTLCAILDEMRPRVQGNYRELIQFVKDRPGHDRRYAIDASKIEKELGWKAEESFETGLRKAVSWYLENLSWVETTLNGPYQKWVAAQYGNG